MREILIGEWSLLVDPEATAERYRVSDSLPAACKCSFCRNFVAARERAYPSELLTLLERLGIDFRREAETSVAEELGGVAHRYYGHFPFVGTVLEGLDPSYPIPLGGGATVSFGGSPVPMTSSMRAAFAGQPLVLLRFSLVVPWVLHDSTVPSQSGPESSD